MFIGDSNNMTYFSASAPTSPQQPPILSWQPALPEEPDSPDLPDLSEQKDRKSRLSSPSSAPIISPLRRLNDDDPVTQLMNRNSELLRRIYVMDRLFTCKGLLEVFSKSGDVVTHIQSTKDEVNKTTDAHLKTKDDVHEFACARLAVDTKQSKMFQEQELKAKLPFALQCLNILDNYEPDAKGNLKVKGTGEAVAFNYEQLTDVVSTVFTKTMTGKNRDLIDSGIKITSGNRNFYARVHAGKLRITDGLGKKLTEEGSAGKINEVWEIVSREMMVFKIALDTDLSKERLKHEARVRTEFNANGDVVEFQDAPTAIYDIPGENLLGILSKKYDSDLFKWLEKNPTNEQRLICAQKVLKAFVKKDKLQFWHADIKPSNFLMEGDEPKLSDLEGGMKFSEAAKKMERPDALTGDYLNLEDIGTIEDLIKDGKDILEAQKAGKSDAEDATKLAEIKKKLVESARSMELFSFAVLLFNILTSGSPFELYDVGLAQEIPNTAPGITEGSLEYLKENYSDDVVNIMVKMLQHFPSKRATLDEVISTFGKMDPKKAAKSSAAQEKEAAANKAATVAAKSNTAAVATTAAATATTKPIDATAKATGNLMGEINK